MSYEREDLYRRALGMKNQRSNLSIEFVASGGVCTPPNPVYALHTFTISKIAAAYDVPPELLLGIPQELPGGP